MTKTSDYPHEHVEPIDDVTSATVKVVRKER